MSERLARLTEAFAIDVCSYTLMSNHYHLVVRLTPERTDTWSSRDIVERWLTLFKGTDEARQFLNGEPLDDAAKRSLGADVEKWQRRLGDLSWFMRCFNEYIARKANAEDECTGHFWESRFKSQALLDEVALITAMTYVDLNPVRATLADSVETSDYTSIQDRWRAAMGQRHRLSDEQRPRLIPFMGVATADDDDALPFNLTDYLDLVDTTGRCIVQGKRGFISATKPALIDRLSINEHQWFDTVRHLHHRYELAIGTPARLRQFAIRWGKRWMSGIGNAGRYYLLPDT
jgi:REP element-mobilizing transposase RayT